MKAGEMDYRIRIEGRVDVPDAIGHPTPTWSEVATVWGGVQYLSGREVMQSGRPIVSEQARVFTRYRADVSTANRLFFDGKVWNITYVRKFEMDKRKDGLEILVEHNV